MNDEMIVQLEKLLREICFKIRVHGREALKNYSITPAQFDLLQKIYFNGPQTMTKLSQMLGIAKSTTTGLVMRLERDGFLKRRQKKEDKRVSFVEITPLGEEVIKAVINYRIDYVRSVTMQLPENDVEKLYSLLDKLVKNMNN
ncbi:MULTISPECIES: MarR family winged helix-turn-helix transcriptional regulator [Fervidobacterium]|uniref:Transcriptional regulator, MarR family n=1 Tax=Fervidobacterium nodosum (strain ATCC 35602 / DSM 5306 / Rt17-B1) TaxID=381764 RepID=A7HJQ3_FERNB|nr:MULTISPECIES: MarR family transcriptional regulator [Fervidobacterium]ABS60136.1 transcriptional regulator, MarR family [Fervidobacterium nodosum Rt17-B1]KAF2961736.1 MarR family transcriptional regulator [Fervidobacterium sp. 2310opik-2]